MKIGVYYYPEQWPAEQWERDFDHIAAMGLQIVHMAEFAWFTLEPKPGEFQFDWLDKCLAMAKQRKLDVILCTPTAAPPIWLSHEHPDTLPIDAHGTRMRVGGRRHYIPDSSKFREATTRIVTAMADHFGDHPSVIGWQIDNEYSGKFDQSPETREHFRKWLRKRYGSIEGLNKAWGNQFWNQFYTDFDQILLPPDRQARYGNPHSNLDASRFWSHAYASFNKLQADILRPKIGKRFITTNFMPFHLDANPAEMADDLTMFTWDAYPVGGREIAPTTDDYRMGDPAMIGFVHDHMKSFHNRWALMELQPGHINHSATPVLPFPGAIHLWIWSALAHGAEFVTTYRYRQPRFGVELFHDGLVGTDGVTPSPGGRQFMQAINELKLIDAKKWNDEANDPKRTVGLLFDFEQLWWFESLPQGKRWDQPKFLRLWYAAIKRLGLDVKILSPKQPWPDDLAMLIAPGFQMVDDEDVAKLTRFVQKGGHLVLTCRSALMDRTGQLFEGKTAQPILDLIGSTIEAYDGLPLETFGQVELDGKKHKWGVWGDLLYASPGTKVLAKYADQFYAGAAAVTQCRRADGGSTTYCGVFAEASFVDALMEKLATQAGMSTTQLPPRVHLERRGPYRVLLNFTDKSTSAPAPTGARFIVGSKRVDPAGVAIWME